MRIYIGAPFSGVETAMANDPAPVGTRYLATKLAAFRSVMKDRLTSEAKAYETLVEKVSRITSEEVGTDMCSCLPDGTWPELELPGTMFDSGLPFSVLESCGCRLSPGSLEFVPARYVESITVFVYAPGAAMKMRMIASDTLRRMFLKYGKDTVYGHGVGQDLMRYAPSPPVVTREYGKVLAAVSVAMRLFPDKVSVVEGGRPDVTTAFGTFANTNLKTREKHLPPDMPLSLGVEKQLAEAVELHTRTVKLLARTSVPDAPPFMSPGSWLCLRTRQYVNVSGCQACMASAGGSVMDSAADNWMDMPCAYETAYGPGPFKSIEESIADHSWQRAELP